jgi:hypothetical protein
MEISRSIGYSSLDLASAVGMLARAREQPATRDSVAEFLGEGAPQSEVAKPVLGVTGEGWGIPFAMQRIFAGQAPALQLT